jgi:fused signal recognition particle receptor
VSHVVLWLIIAVASVVLVAATVGLVRVRRRRGIESGRGPTLDAAPPVAPIGAQPVAEPAATTVEAATAEPRHAEPVTGQPDATAAALAAPPALSARLGSARSLFDRVRALRGRSTLGAGELAEVEEALLRADVGTTTTASILEAITASAAARTLGDDGVTGALRRELLAVLGPAPASLSTEVAEDHVAVWLFVGVNGVGKTTTIGKVAAAESRSLPVLLAAGDTFRAAAADQLETWATRVGCDLVRADEGADPGAVVHDALHRAASKGIPLVLADTAGRLHNKANLLEELKKVRRVADRAPGQVAEVLLVLDATTGQNAIAQAREFSDAVGVTGIVLTKLDGTARGGVVLAVQRELGIPVRLVGVGEQVEDLVAFDPEAFVDALLGD